MIEKIVNVEIKTSFQPLLGIRNIGFKYQKGYKPTKKEEARDNKNNKNRNKNNSS